MSSLNLRGVRLTCRCECLETLKYLKSAFLLWKKRKREKVRKHSLHFCHQTDLFYHTVHYSLIYSSRLGTRHSAARSAMKRQICSSVPRSPFWLSGRRTCRGAALPRPHSGGRTPCTRRGGCPPSTRFARWSWRRTSSPPPLFDWCVPGGWAWWSGCRRGPGTSGWWWARRSPRCCSRRTATRRKQN